MEYNVDLQKLCNGLHNCEQGRIFSDEQIQTPGGHYLYEQILPKLLYDDPLLVGDIDFDAFDEDDIVDLIDNHSETWEKQFKLIQHIEAVLAKSPALQTSSRKFF